MAVSKGDVVLIDFPFTDLSQTKLRPAVVLWVSSVSNDITLCAITSQNVNDLTIEEFLIKNSDSEFQSTGLRVSSKVKVTRVVTLNRSLIVRRIGRLGTQYLQELNTRIIQAFQLN